MNRLHPSILLNTLVAVFALCASVAGASNATQLYGLTQDASIELSGRALAALEGTIRLGPAGLCVLPPGGPTSCIPPGYNINELDLFGDGTRLALPPSLPDIPRASLIFRLGGDIEIEDASTGSIRLLPLVLEREILAEGERAPGEGFVEYRELRLAPAFDISGSGYGWVDFDPADATYPSGMRLNYVLQEVVATVIHDTNGSADGSIFLAYIEPGSESFETLGIVTIHAAPIAEPPQPLPAEGGFTGLGPTRGESYATGVSNDGRSVSGYARPISSISTNGFRWTQGTRARAPLGNLRGLGTGLGLAISPDGLRVAGSFDAAQYSNPSREAARWNHALELERLSGPAVYQQSVGEDITSGGKVAGWQQVQSPYRIQAQIWDAQGNRSPLPDLSPSERPFGRAHALSEDGSIAVGVSARSDLVPNTAVRWSDVGVEDLKGLAADGLSWAWDVSADGDTAVGWSDNEAQEREAFRWTKDSGMQGLGDLPGGSQESEALAVSADGWFVVGTSMGANGEEAFLWDSRRGMRRLQEVIEHALGQQLVGWQLTRATGITPDGGVMVGDGINPEGYTEAWRAVLPAVITDVEVDVLPRHSPNRFPSNRLFITAAILGSESTDIDQIDIDSLTFGPDRAAPLRDLFKRRRRYNRTRDVNHDGHRDLVLHFRLAKTGLTPDHAEACLSGEMDGVRFTACDEVEIERVPLRRWRSWLWSWVPSPPIPMRPKTTRPMRDWADWVNSAVRQAPLKFGPFKRPQ